MSDLIILCGGLGTRLKSLVPDKPKALAPVNGRPFLSLFLETALKFKEVKRIIFALGYGAEAILEFIEKHPLPLPWDYTVETTLLGTGGAARLAAEKTYEEQILVVNGDTLVSVDLDGLLVFHREKQADCSIALAEVEDKRRFGNVTFDRETARITGFQEKQQVLGKGWINAGVYCIQLAELKKKRLGKNFSMEYDFFPSLVSKRVYGYPSKAFFLDIGTEDSYFKAQEIYK